MGIKRVLKAARARAEARKSAPIVSGKRRSGPPAFLGAVAAIALAAPLTIMTPMPAAANLLNADIAPRVKPAAPGPAYISRNDLARMKVLREAVKSRNFSAARRSADTLEDPIARSLGQWYYFYGQDPRVDIADATAFLNAHPEWPMQTRIQKHVEDRIVSTTSSKDILALFEQRDPITGSGKVALGRAQFANGEREAGALHIRDAWANGSFTLPEERSLLANYAGILRVEDHIARVDRLLWGRQVTNARRVFKYLPAAERRKAEARAALLTQSRNGASVYNRLSEADRNDAGVLHAAIRYFRRAREETRAIGLARTAPTDPDYLRNPARFWQERQLLMRWALKNRQYADAYSMAAGHGLEQGTTLFSEAEFNAGWIALRFLDKPKRAETHFAALTASVGTPISLSRGYYWMGRAALAAGDKDAAKRRFEQAASYPYAYYGQLAIEQLGARLDDPRFNATAFQPIPPASAEEKARFASRPAAQALRMLTEVNDPRAFLIFGYHLDDKLESAGEFLELADAALQAQAPHVTVRAGKAGVRRGIFAPQVVYPTIYIPDEAKRFVPPEVILGLSRQESEFNPRAYSPAGARGVMQLMPATAEITARKERVPYRRSALLNDPNYNMLIGSAHLYHLLTDLNGHYPMVFAGYNAGKGRVRQWIEAFGDPRSPHIDPVDWVEQIPFSETRNYVQRVMENIQVYRSQLTGAPLAAGLAGALERGGPSGRVAGLPPLRTAGVVPDIAPRITAIAAPVLDALLLEAENQSHETAGLGAAAPLTPAATKASPPKIPTAAPLNPPANNDGAKASAKREARSAPAATQKSKQPNVATAQTPDSVAPASVRPESVRPGSVTREPASPKTAAPAPLDTAPSDTASFESTPAQAPLTMAPIADGDGSTATPTQTAASAGAASPRSQADILNARQSGARAEAPTPTFTKTSGRAKKTDCVTYADFLSNADPEAAAAADLNAGALAELQSGGPVCQ